MTKQLRFIRTISSEDTRLSFNLASCSALNNSMSVIQILQKRRMPSKLNRRFCLSEVRIVAQVFIVSRSLDCLRMSSQLNCIIIFSESNVFVGRGRSYPLGKHIGHNRTYVSSMRRVLNLRQSRLAGGWLLILLCSIELFLTR